MFPSNAVVVTSGLGEFQFKTFALSIPCLVFFFLIPSSFSSSNKHQNGDVEFFFQKNLSDRLLLFLKINKIQHFRRLQKLCLTDFRVLLSKCFLSTFQIPKFLGGAVRLDFEKNTPNRSILYPTPYCLSTLLGHPIIHIWPQLQCFTFAPRCFLGQLK